MSNSQRLIDLLRSAEPNTWIAVDEVVMVIVGRGLTITEARKAADGAGYANALILYRPPGTFPESGAG